MKKSKVTESQDSDSDSECEMMNGRKLSSLQLAIWIYEENGRLDEVFEVS